jgi:hypothetical protein
MPPFTQRPIGVVVAPSADRTLVEILVDPICPFAWLTSRWLDEVARHREIDVAIGLMSLSVLNDGRDGLSDFYRALIDSGWGPARVAAAVGDRFGAAGLRRFYDAFGRRHHVGGEPLGDHLALAALGDAGLPDELALAADSSELDDLVRAHHADAVDLVGDDAGTPVLRIHVAGAAPVGIFGPVVTPCPRGDAAVRLWDAVVLAASTEEFFELKRSRTRALAFD